MIVRPEAPADRNAVRAVHAASFPTLDEARLEDALREHGRLLVSLVAETDGRVVGHAAFSPVELAGATGGAGLGPVAVLPAFRRRGIAERLVREGLDACRRLGLRFAVVLGDPAYYARFGFEPAGRRGLSCAFGGGDAFQVLELAAGAIPSAGGLVSYAPEFDAFGEEETG